MPVSSVPAAALVLALLALAGCATVNISDRETALLAAPVECGRAQAQIAELEAIRPTAGREAAAAASVIGVVGLSTAVASGRIDDRERLAGGAYRAEVDAKIDGIRKTCGL